MNITIQKIRDELRSESDPAKSAFLPGFFKLEPGEQDTFLGVIVPKQRAIAKRNYLELAPKEVLELLHSIVHEERLTALFIWVLQYKKGNQAQKKEIYTLYLLNTKWVNNWDLVDSSASYIVGDYIYDKDRTILESLSISKNVWERRIAMLAAGEFIRHGEYDWTLKLAERYMHDTHHYIHKATGWMLREVGKRDEAVLRDFLDNFAPRMPRTALRYAIERLDEVSRKKYLTL